MPVLWGALTFEGVRELGKLLETLLGLLGVELVPGECCANSPGGNNKMLVITMENRMTCLLRSNTKALVVQRDDSHPQNDSAEPSKRVLRFSKELLCNSAAPFPACHVFSFQKVTAANRR